MTEVYWGSAPSVMRACIVAFEREFGAGRVSRRLFGFIVFETFSFLWTSQVIGNVALATLAGGPFGSKAPPSSNNLPKF